MSRSFGPGCSRVAIASRASSRMRSSHFFKEAGRNHSAAMFRTIVCSGGSRYGTASRIRRLPPVAGLVLQDRVVRAGLCPAATGEDRRLLLDLHDVGVLGDEPERVIALDADLRQRRVLAEPLVRREKRLFLT